MVNDDERNQAYDLALRRAVKPGDLVLEIGTGSGLVAMMAVGAARDSNLKTQNSKEEKPKTG